jgi:hypothetical protein
MTAEKLQQGIVQFIHTTPPPPELKDSFRPFHRTKTAGLVKSFFREVPWNPLDRKVSRALKRGVLERDLNRDQKTISLRNGASGRGQVITPGEGRD